eukprot:gene12135-biopygen11577
MKFQEHFGGDRRARRPEFFVRALVARPRRAREAGPCRVVPPPEEVQLRAGTGGDEPLRPEPAEGRVGVRPRADERDADRPLDAAGGRADVEPPLDEETVHGPRDVLVAEHEGGGARHAHDAVLPSGERRRADDDRRACGEGDVAGRRPVHVLPPLRPGRVPWAPALRGQLRRRRRRRAGL